LAGNFISNGGSCSSTVTHLLVLRSDRLYKAVGKQYNDRYASKQCMAQNFEMETQI